MDLLAEIFSTCLTPIVFLYMAAGVLCGICIGALPGLTAVMGVALLIVQRGYGLAAAVLCGFFGGVGATIALMCFAGLQRDVSFTSCPKCFQGLPIALVTIGLMDLSLMGFYGLYLG